MEAEAAGEVEVAEVVEVEEAEEEAEVIFKNR